MSTAESSNPREQRIEELEDALEQKEQRLASRPVIEEAKGMLMQDFDLTPDEAFEFLRALSQDTNTKVREVSARLVSELTGVSSQGTTESTMDVVANLRERLRQPRS